jgi:hypothetical protein
VLSVLLRITDPDYLFGSLFTIYSPFVFIPKKICLISKYHLFYIRKSIFNTRNHIISDNHIYFLISEIEFFHNELYDLFSLNAYSVLVSC